ncbi:MAG: response regulator [Myxococcaceae bacterium]|nr:response regulator [Myxococcaceae bacterium]
MSAEDEVARTKRVLFVDDEPLILAALKSALRSMRGEWQMTFAEGPVCALEAMAEAPFDVVVTDMRMPGMDGAELLRRVAAQWPKVGRVLLTGYADAAALERARDVAQLMLDKPCTTNALREALEDVGP